MHNTTGVYTDILPAANACDSTVTTNLTVNPAATGSQTATVCAGSCVTVGSNTYCTTGIYTDVLSTLAGCDSIVTTNLTVSPAITGSQSMTICYGTSVTIGGNTHTSSGVYNDILPAANGCDSVLTTTLTVSSPIASTQIVSLCQGQSLFVGTSIYYSSGIYTDMLNSFSGCDSVVITNLTVHPNPTPILVNALGGPYCLQVTNVPLSG